MLDLRSRAAPRSSAAVDVLVRATCCDRNQCRSVGCNPQLGVPAPSAPLEGRLRTEFTFQRKIGDPDLKKEKQIGCKLRPCSRLPPAADPCSSHSLRRTITFPQIPFPSHTVQF